MKFIVTIVTILTATATLAAAYPSTNNAHDVESRDLGMPHLASRTVKCPKASTINEVLSKLPPREQQVVKMRFGIGQQDHTLEEVARQLDVTRERVRQIEAKAMKSLRAALCTV